MQLTLRQVHQAVHVTTRLSTYTVFIWEDDVKLVGVGVEEEYFRSDFPKDAEPLAIAAFLVAQLETEVYGE